MDNEDCDNAGAYIFDCSFLILARNKDNNKSLNEFEFQAELTSDCGVNCRWASGVSAQTYNWKSV